MAEPHVWQRTIFAWLSQAGSEYAPSKMFGDSAEH
jgi:hypothetical protein